MTDNLEARLQGTVKTIKGRADERYQLAKKLGFKGWELMVVKNWKKDNIRQLAKERGYIS